MFMKSNSSLTGWSSLPVAWVNTMSMVSFEKEHTVIVKTTSNRIPMVKPACRKAYGWPADV